MGFGVLLAQLSPAFADERGWQYLTDKLVADGVARGRVETVFRDPRIAAFTGLDFSPDPPREPRTLYRHFLHRTSVAAARRCRMEHARAFEKAGRAHGVSPNLLAAILYIESGCGRHTGSNVIFYRLARLAMANAPDNVQRNIERLALGEGALDPRLALKVRARARYLEATFYPEVRALFEIADRVGIDPLDIHGSSSGAFGEPQFLPTSYLAYGTDGNGDGRVSLYDTADAAASCARYFAAHGWRPGLSLARRRAVIWHYNRSTSYVDTVLALARRIGEPRHAGAHRVTRHRKPRHRHAHALRRAARRPPASRPRAASSRPDVSLAAEE